MLSSMPCLAADVNITINGEEFIPKNALGEVVEPFIANGSTYLPVRAMGEAVGKEVSFDAENYAVYIGIRPMGGDLNSIPFAMVEGRIYTESEMALFGTIEDAKQTEAVIKLAEATLDKAVLDEAYNALMAFYEADVDYSPEPGWERYMYASACANALVENYVVDEKEYDNYVTAQHILVTDEALCNEILEKIAKGEDFSALIEEYNTDPGQSKNSSYTFTYGEMVEEFEKAAFALKEGEYTAEGVKTAYGYHIIKRLPLDKSAVDKEAMAIASINEKLNKLEIKAVEVVGEGYYGSVDNTAFTSAELKAFSSLLGYAPIASYGLEIVKEYAALKATCEELELFDENMLESTKMVLLMSGFDASLFGDKGAYFLELLAVMEAASLKEQDGELPENFNELWMEKFYSMESERYNELRVFVDGKLLVPADVNNNYVSPKNIDGTVFVPVRAIVEALGMKAGWDNDARCVVIEK